MNDDCLFCKLYREGDHVVAADGFVAIRDINPQAPTHLLVIPERHIESFHRIGELTPDEDKRMLDFIAEVGATSMADLGRVMADVMPQIAGRADGSQVSQIVREKLA